MRFSAWIALAVAALLALLGSMFVVSEGHGAIVFRLGTIVRRDIGPGLHFKWPLVENAAVFDRRLQVLTAAPERYLTADKLDVSVDFFAVGQIENLSRFYQATGGDEKVAAERLAPIIKDSLRNEINSRTLIQVVSGDRATVIGKQLVGINRAASTLGVRILDIRIKRIDLPQDSNVLASVYNRMRSQRLQVASQKRAEGVEQSQAIRATADRDKTVIVAEAERDAQRLRGEGDAEAASTYAAAANKDPSFYSFQRSLEAYRQSFKDGDSVIVLDRDDPFLQYLKSDR
ncbi:MULTISPECIES: protease modulator HflC [unclassified Lysobacter]|uniref:protease modulator HflC n=1 Tax=unclassified Lysobacter TaxID=2635362 RepID=UPI0006F8612A|nr:MULTISPECIES: protease modulator HflC [unclassified Lysobacter]KQZ66117.1 protease modulator HflC [Lysobacter sp. Root559]KRA72891.1 protease modulator HflC [Lysobacter sp. Root667]KRC32145.1 protease modulator HflC [Lysobacter sp. Root76]KRD67607.1 protease modulator HflC [Lysobacter sp. Root96]